MSSQSAVGTLFSNSAISSHLQEVNYPEKSIKSMLRCGKPSGVTIFAHCDCGAYPIELKHRCNLRTCPDCAKIRKRKIVRKYFPFLEKIKQDRKNFLYFLTISPKNYEDLQEGYEHIRKSFSKFLRHKYIKERLKGGFYVIETKGTKRNWNIHLHIICYGQFLDNRIRGKCLDCGQNLIKFDYHNKKYYCASKKCNSLNVIYKQDSKLVSLFKQSSKRDCNVHISRQGSVKFTLNYMCKYISSNKDEFDTPKDLAMYISSTRKRKLINSFGCFFNAKFTKTVCYCSKCESVINFIIDFELMKLYESSERRDLDYQRSEGFAEGNLSGYSSQAIDL